MGADSEPSPQEVALRPFLDDLVGVPGAARRLTERPAQLAGLVSWLDGADGPPLCLLTGAPGSGKSALLATLVIRALARYPHERLAVAQLRQRTVTDVATSVAQQLSLSKLGDSWTGADLVEALADRTGPVPALVLDDVDEATHPDEIITLLVVPLAHARRPDGTSACRIVVGIGPSWDRFPGLREAITSAGQVHDLDAVPRDELGADLATFLAASLADLPGYAEPSQEAIRATLAELVAHRLASGPRGGAFLVAALYLNHLAMIPAASSADEARQTAAAVPAEVADVIELDLATRGDRAPAARSVLAVVAQAKGEGAPLDLIAAPSLTGEQIQDTLRYLTVYLGESVDTDGSTLYRLRHRALVDHPGAPPRQTTSWADAPYLRRHAIAHGIDDDTVDELLTDPEFLTYADPTTLAPELWRARGDGACLAAAVYRTSLSRHRDADPDTRRRVLILDAIRFGDQDLARRLQGHDRTPMSPVWATGAHVDSSRFILSGPGGGVMGLACARVHDRPVAVAAGGGDSTVRMWDLLSGQQIGAPLRHGDVVAAVACGHLDGRPVAVTGDWGSSVRVWDLDTGQLRTKLAGQRGQVLAVACTEMDGRPVAIAGGQDSRVLVWDLTTGQLRTELTGHQRPVCAIACTRLDGRLIVVAGTGEGMVRMWDLTTGEPIGDPLAGHTGTVFAVDCVEIDGRPTAVSGAEDGTVRRWDLATGQPIGGPLTGHASLPGIAGRVITVACTHLDGRPVAITGAWDGAVRMWDLTTGLAIGTPPTEPERPVSAAAWTTVAGRTLALTGDWSGIVTVFDVTTTQPLGKPLVGHTDRVRAVTCGQYEGQPVAITRGRRGVIRMWDLIAAQPVGEPFEVDADTGSPIACATVDGRFIVVTGGDIPVRVWDWNGGQPIETRLAGHARPVSAIACATVEDTPVAVTAGVDGTIRLWDLVALRPFDSPIIRQDNSISQLACAQLDGRLVAVVDVGGATTARVWDLTTGQPLSPPLTGHTGPVSAVAWAELDGRPVALTGSWDSRVLLWDVTTGQPTGTALIGHTDIVTAITCTTLYRRPVAFTGGLDHTVRVWDLATGICLDAMPMPGPPVALAVAEDGRLVVAADRDIYVFSRAWPS